MRGRPPRTRQRKRTYETDRVKICHNTNVHNTFARRESVALLLTSATDPAVVLLLRTSVAGRARRGITEDTTLDLAPVVFEGVV